MSWGGLACLEVSGFALAEGISRHVYLGEVGEARRVESGPLQVEVERVAVHAPRLARRHELVQ